MLEERDYKCGDIFQDTSDITRVGAFKEVGGLWYILAQVDTRTFSLISLKDGNRWNDPVKADDSTLDCVTFETILAVTRQDKNFRYVPPEEYLNEIDN